MGRLGSPLHARVRRHPPGNNRRHRWSTEYCPGIAINRVSDVDQLLAADPIDAGCAAGFEILHRYVDEEAAGGEPERFHPGLAAHLRACPACRADYLGLIEAARVFGEPGR